MLSQIKSTLLWFLTVVSLFFSLVHADLSTNIAWCGTNSWNLSFIHVGDGLNEVVTETFYDECVSLAYLYDETNGDNRTNNGQWFSSTNLATWVGRWGGFGYGFVIDTGHIVRIQLFSNNLVGNIVSGLNNMYWLTDINLSSNNLTGINLSHNTGLTSLWLPNMNIGSLDLSNNTNLESINLVNTNVTWLDLSNNTGLTYIDLGTNDFTSFDASIFPWLTDLALNNNPISTLDVTNNPLLSVLNLNSAFFTWIDLSQNLNLRYLYLSNNALSSLDISNNTWLVELLLDHNTWLQTLTIAHSGAYTQLVTGNYDYDFLCTITNTNLLSFLNTTDTNRSTRQLCSVTDLSTTSGNGTVTLDWDTNDYGYIAGLSNYSLSWVPNGIGNVTISSGAVSYTATGLSSQTTYTFTLCSLYDESTVCETVTGTSLWLPGCIDPIAENYNSTALHNDGSCTYAITIGAGGWWGGGGWWSYLATINQGANGNDYNNELSHSDSSWWNNNSLENNTINKQCADQEYQIAYDFAHSYEITTLPSCQEANMDGTLLRKHAAKMMSNYSINVLGQNPDLSRVCKFSDMTNEDEEMLSFATLACQLGIMGLRSDGTPDDVFNPNGLVDKAQFATILSRVLYGTANNTADGSCWYCQHVQALQAAGIINVTSDLFEPLKRAWAMLMLQRSK